MIRVFFALLALATTSAVPTASAYFTPEEVLLHQELFLPPTSREALDKTRGQSRASNLRREREQERAFALQRPEPQEPLFASAPAAPTGASPIQIQLVTPGAASTATDAELLRTIRLLNRVQKQQTQAVIAYGAHSPLHRGAPLAPTGPGAVLAAAAMAGGFGWTLRRSKNEKVVIK